MPIVEFVCNAIHAHIFMKVHLAAAIKALLNMTPTYAKSQLLLELALLSLALHGCHRILS
jgi:hypothetical protein